ncbi:MAG TPA: SCO1664 family protein [Acidimicrobiales bacterium]|nr:SCO1664 family protein [Acidimicrobiales bacterium]
MPAHQRQPTAAALRLLAVGAVEMRGRMPWSSNATFLVSVSDGNETTDAVYTPLRGERGLWDFPDGLYRREAAAYELSRALRWGLVPETIVRDDGLPYGRGSLQRFVDADFSQHYFTLLEREEHAEALRQMAVFDLLANNADRKGGHVLVDRDGHLWGIDNGLSFHPELKLRSVIWDFAGEQIDAAWVDDVRRLCDQVPDRLTALLGSDELEALVERASAVVSDPVFPHPHGRHPFPWPLV